MPTPPPPETVPDHSRTIGARPAGTTSEQDAATNVQQMFDTIAPTYDRANHLLSAGIDRLWWNRTARTLRPLLQPPEAVVVDLCCGTGDMTLALYKYRPKPARNPDAPALLISTESGPETTRLGAPPFPALPERVGCSPLTPTSATVDQAESPSLQSELKHPRTAPAPILAIDFSHEMLTRGAAKFAPYNILPVEADALHLPLADKSVDLVTTAFGFRNLANYAEGLAELHRILRPGGQIAILECNQPDGLIGVLYSFYFKRILPKLGGLVTRNPTAYAYLPDSVERFPRPPRMLQLLAEANFTAAAWTSYTFGISGLYRATKP